MLSNKSLALALCLTITGCAQTPQNDAEGGHWWSFGSDKAATKDPVAQTDTKPDAKPDAKPAAGAKPVEPVTAAAATPAAKADTGYSWWPFSTKTAEEKAADAKADLKADLKAATPASDAAPVVAKTDSEPRWWWPFESKPKPLAKVDVTNVQMPDPKVTQAWLDSCSDGFLNCSSQSAAGSVWFQDKSRMAGGEPLSHNQSRRACFGLDTILRNDMK